INGGEISDDDFALLHDVVDRTAERLVGEGELPWHPSFFEMLTAMAFEYFARRKVDLAVLEVGMGGRLDATNVIEPRVSVITDISLDHQKFLGNTVAKIAREKAGIIHPGGIVVTLPQQPQANDVIGNTILEMDATAVRAVPYVPPVAPGSDCGYGSRGKSLTTECTEDTERSDHRQPVWRYPLQVMGQKICVETPLIGRHQLRNAALAIAAAEELGKQGFAITAASIERGIGEMAEILFSMAERVIATRADNPRSATPDEIRSAAARTSAEIETAPDVAAALAQARASAGSDRIVVVTGSIYVVGEAMRLLGA